jgi:hypothetical protein
LITIKFGFSTATTDPAKTIKNKKQRIPPQRPSAPTPLMKNRPKVGQASSLPEWQRAIQPLSTRRRLCKKAFKHPRHAHPHQSRASFQLAHFRKNTSTPGSRLHEHESGSRLHALQASPLCGRKDPPSLCVSPTLQLAFPPRPAPIPAHPNPIVPHHVRPRHRLRHQLLPLSSH